MGNALGGKRRAKVMKIDGSTVKVKPPAVAKDILRDNPGFVLLDSEQVKLLGVRAKPLDPDQALKPKKLYFLVELPKIPPADRPHMTSTNRVRFRSGRGGAAGKGEGEGTLRVWLRLSKSQVARLVEESSDPAQAGEKIMELCTGTGGGGGAQGSGDGRVAAAVSPAEPPAPRKVVNGAVREKEVTRVLTGRMRIGSKLIRIRIRVDMFQDPIQSEIIKSTGNEHGTSRRQDRGQSGYSAGRVCGGDGRRVAATADCGGLRLLHSQHGGGKKREGMEEGENNDNYFNYLEQPTDGDRDGGSEDNIFPGSPFASACDLSFAASTATSSSSSSRAESLQGFWVYPPISEYEEIPSFRWLSPPHSHGIRRG